MVFIPWLLFSHEYSVVMGNLSNLSVLQVCNLGITFYPELPLCLCLRLRVNLAGCYSVVFLAEALYPQRWKSQVQILITSRDCCDILSVVLTNAMLPTSIHADAQIIFLA